LTEEPRLFVAVPLDEGARAAVEAVVDGVRAGEPEGRGVRWVRLEGLHITLRFLGPTPEPRVEQLADAVRAVGAGAAPIRATITGAGSFPSTGRPRTLWLGLTDGADDLARLAGRLDDALAERGWERDRRPFRAHLTLARADGVRVGAATAAALAEAANRVAIPAAFDRLVLFESVTGSGRARYVSRADVPLG
jgi:RNA 2',3'-cyclic 3'-phosphodiesterase